MSDDTEYNDKNTKAVPSGRWSRMGKLGSLASSVAGGMLAEGARQLASGKRPKARELLLTPGNAKRVADQLAQLRGAAMKVGQLMSMDAGDILPPELTEILSRLRANAEPMPFSQLTQVLHENWGADWNNQFKQFSFKPMAAASIGQVHSAQTKDDRHLALKVQYPGIRESIDSDVDNVATLLRVSGLIPKGLDIAPLLQDAKVQLHAEADYQQEANWIRHFHELLGDNQHFLIPEVYEDFTTTNILAMSFVEGVDIESLEHASQEDRNRVIELLMELLFRELFEFQVVQTDPNFANYQYNVETHQLVLLDFGATRAYPDKIVQGYRALMQGAIDDDHQAMDQAAENIGFFQESIKAEQRAAVVDVFLQACEPLIHEGKYDFGTTNLAQRIRDEGMSLSMEKEHWHTPPADAIFLHRKLGGVYLLAAKLKAQVDVRSLFLNAV
ncbi:MAG: Ubiquinone biosynthesis monooxygenase UbiB, partial [uncultured Thiotrichaceae bacterium]